MPLRQQRIRVVHAAPQRLGALGQPDPAALGRRPPGLSRRRAAPSAPLPFCTLWTENDRQPVLQVAHTTRWRQLGRPEREDYVAHCLLRGKARIDFRGLSPQLKLEFQYAVQCRHDQADASPLRRRW